MNLEDAAQVVAFAEEACKASGADMRIDEFDRGRGFLRLVLRGQDRDRSEFFAEFRFRDVATRREAEKEVSMWVKRLLHLERRKMEEDEVSFLVSTAKYQVSVDRFDTVAGALDLKWLSDRDVAKFFEAGLEVDYDKVRKNFQLAPAAGWPGLVELVLKV
jgi:hypothetical protein